MVTFTKEQLISTTPQERRAYLAQQQRVTYEEPVTEVVTGPTEEELAKYEEQQRLIEEYNQKIAGYNKEVEEWKLAERFVRDRPNMIGFLPTSIQIKARELQKQGVESWDQIKSARNYQVLINEYKQKLEAEKLATAPRDTGFYLDVGTGKTYAKPETTPGGFVEAPEVLQAQIPTNNIYKPEIKQQEIFNQLKQGTVEPFKTPTNLGVIGGTRYTLSETNRRLETGDITTKKGFVTALKKTGIGFAVGLLDVGYSITNPVQTGIGVKEFITNKEYRSKVGENIGNVLFYDPQFSVGYGLSQPVGDIIITKTVTGTTNLIGDFGRTILAKELPVKEIVAPEFFAGQTYPKIKPGQTAGQLLKEFLGSKLPGEPANTKGLFTAYGTPIDKSTKTVVGGSEVPGMYGAPKTSATFLRLTDAGYSYGLGLNPFSQSIFPTIIRTLVEDIKLAPGVKPSQKTFLPVSKVYSFFESAKGRLPEAFLPFVKSEKEAVIPADIPISRENYFARYYIKFEGRKVPIYQYATSKIANSLGVKSQGITTLLDVYNRYYNKGPGYSFTPYGSLGSLVSSTTLKSSIIKPSVSSYVGIEKPSYQIVSLPSKTYYPDKRSITYPSYKSSIISRISAVTYTPKSITSSRIGITSNYRSLIRSNNYPRYPAYSIPSTPYVPIPRYNQEGSYSRYYGLTPSEIQAFRVFTKRYGKVIELARGLPRGKALLTGARYTKGTLGASFKIEPFGTTTTPDISFTPDQEFRTYRVSRGRRIPLTDEFIQRRKFRLSSIPERREILQAKRSKRRLTWL